MGAGCICRCDHSDRAGRTVPASRRSGQAGCRASSLRLRGRIMARARRVRPRCAVTADLGGAHQPRRRFCLGADRGCGWHRAWPDRRLVSRVWRIAGVAQRRRHPVLPADPARTARGDVARPRRRHPDPRALNPVCARFRPRRLCRDADGAQPRLCRGRACARRTHRPHPVAHATAEHRGTGAGAAVARSCVCDRSRKRVVIPGPWCCTALAVLGADDPWRPRDHGAGAAPAAVAVRRAGHDHPRDESAVRRLARRARSADRDGANNAPPDRSPRSRNRCAVTQRRTAV